MWSWGAQRALSGPEGFRGVPGVLRWYSEVLKQSWVGPEGSKIPGGPRSPEESCWIGRVLRAHDKSWGLEGSSYILKGPSWPNRTLQDLFWSLRTPHGPLRTFQSLSNTPYPSAPLDPSRPLRTPLEPSGPPHDCFRTSEYPFSSPGTPQNPTGPIRTHQGPLSPSWSQITIVLTC